METWWNKESPPWGGRGRGLGAETENGTTERTEKYQDWIMHPLARTSPPSLSKQLLSSFPCTRLVQQVQQHLDGALNHSANITECLLCTRPYLKCWRHSCEENKDLYFHGHMQVYQKDKLLEMESLQQRLCAFFILLPS